MQPPVHFSPEIQLMAAVFRCVRMQINTPMLMFFKMGFFASEVLCLTLWPWHCLYLCLFLAGSKWCSDGSPAVMQCYLERSSGGHLVQPPARSRTAASTKTGQPWFFSRQVRKTSKDRNIPASMGSLVCPALPYPWHIFFPDIYPEPSKTVAAAAFYVM